MIPIDENDGDDDKGVDFESIEEHLRGDAIGDTTYSERFVLSTLMQMIRVEEVGNGESPLEENLCTLWDMTVERDIVLYLLRREVLSSISLALPLTNNNRIIEILLGIVGNMCCEEETLRELDDKQIYLEYFLEYIHSDDSFILIQILRLMSTGIYKDNNKQKWLEILNTIEFQRALSTILHNSANKDVLLNAFETFNCICSMCYEDEFKELFITMFVNTNIVNGFIVAFRELSQLDNDQINRFHSVFININIIIIDCDPDNYGVLIEDKDKLVECLNDIIEKNVVDLEFDFDENMIDIYEGVTQILSAVGMPQTSFSNRLFVNYFDTWLFAERAIVERSRAGHNLVPENEVQVYQALKSSLAQYFVRFFKVTPMNMLKQVLSDKVDTVTSVLTTIKVMCEEGTISKNVIRENLYSIIEDFQVHSL